MVRETVNYELFQLVGGSIYGEPQLQENLGLYLSHQTHYLNIIYLVVTI